jgi:hypothetical protein
MGDSWLASCIRFGRTVVGITTRPYETYRRVVDRGSLWELIYVAALLGLYFGNAALVKTASFHPFLLTRQFLVLSSAAGLTYLISVGLFWTVGKYWGARGDFRGFLLAWGYTLIPTVVWFWSTSLLYVLIPPPRTTSPEGQVFSVLYLLFSATMLFWKVILSYLALRFGLKLDLAKISIVSVIVLPMLFVYSLGMYWMGIFRIPFL